MKKIKVTYADGNSSPKMNQFSAPWPVFYEVWNVLQSCKRTTTPMKTGQIIADYSSIGLSILGAVHLLHGASATTNFSVATGRLDAKMDTEEERPRGERVA